MVNNENNLDIQEGWLIMAHSLLNTKQLLKLTVSIYRHKLCLRQHQAKRKITEETKPQEIYQIAPKEEKG